MHSAAPAQTYNGRISNSLAQSQRQYSPPPPNLYGADYGQAFGNAPHGNFQQPLINHAELEAAETDIRKAWKAGRVWCIFAGVITLIMFFLMFAMAASAPKMPMWILVLPFLILVPMISAVIGLVYGVYKKNRACAVVLLVLMCLSILLNLLSMALTPAPQTLGSLLFAGILCYYFALGVRGTFKYHRLVNP
jgi:serine/threonine-protein kinase